MPYSIATYLTQATERLTAHGVSTPRLDAAVLLAHTLGISRTKLFARLQDSLSNTDAARYDQLIKRRQQREPLQYITGVQEFWSLEFRVTRDVLIPRPETELIVETALRLRVGGQGSGVKGEEEKQKAKSKKQKAIIEPLSSESGVWTLDSGPLVPDPRSLAPTLRTPHSTLRILDVGTGSGCLAIALAKELPEAELWATDISSAALTVAQGNAQQHGVAERIHFLCGDLFTPLQDLNLAFDLIVTNPPYIAQPHLRSLQPEVQEWEPHLALAGGTDGLDCYRRLLQEGPHYLHTEGWLVMEIGHDQGHAVLQLAQQQPALSHVTCLCDYEGRERVITGQKL